MVWSRAVAFLPSLVLQRNLLEEDSDEEEDFFLWVCTIIRAPIIFHRATLKLVEFKTIEGENYRRVNQEIL